MNRAAEKVHLVEENQFLRERIMVQDTWKVEL